MAHRVITGEDAELLVANARQIDRITPDRWLVQLNAHAGSLALQLAMHHRDTGHLVLIDIRHLLFVSQAAVDGVQATVGEQA